MRVWERLLVRPRRRRPCSGRRALDPKTSRHAPECEYRDETNPAQLKLLLEVKDGMGGLYWWVTCHHCRVSWQVPYYAEGVG